MKKLTISKLQKKLWDECRRIIRARYGNTCFTCFKGGLEGSNWHTGHGYPKGSLGAAMKYDLRILRPQCYNCNINLGGMGAVFWRHLESQIGLEESELLYELCQESRRVSIKAHDYYLRLLEEYKLIKK